MKKFTFAATLFLICSCSTDQSKVFSPKDRKIEGRKFAVIVNTKDKDIIFESSEKLSETREKEAKNQVQVGLDERFVLAPLTGILKFAYYKKFGREIEAEYSIKDPTKEISDSLIKNTSSRYNMQYKGTDSFNIETKSWKFADDYKHVDYVYLVDPTLLIRKSGFNSYTIKYMYTYTLYDTHNGDELFADSCNYNSDGSWSYSEIIANKAAIIKAEISKAKDICIANLEQHIDKDKEFRYHKYQIKQTIR